ncbi:MAG TPA: hypothetical protein VF459_12685 [Caulobacteraceae bacterium]
MSMFTTSVAGILTIFWIGGSLLGLACIAFPLKGFPILATRTRAFLCLLTSLVVPPVLIAAVVNADPQYVASSSRAVVPSPPVDTSATAADTVAMSATPDKVINSRADCPPEDEADREMMRHGLPSGRTLCLLQADAAMQKRAEDEANAGLPPRLQHHDKLNWDQAAGD